MLNGPRGVAVDAAGNVYIADSGNNRVRKVAAGGNDHHRRRQRSSRLHRRRRVARSARRSATRQHRRRRRPATSTSRDGARVRKVFASGHHLHHRGQRTPRLLRRRRRSPSPPSSTARRPRRRFRPATSTSPTPNNNAVRAAPPLAGGLAISAVTNGASNQPGVDRARRSRGHLRLRHGPGSTRPYPAQRRAEQSATTLAGTSVFFNGTPAPVLYTSANQVGVIVPFGLTGPRPTLSVTYQGQVSSATHGQRRRRRPALFTLNEAAPDRQSRSIRTDRSTAPRIRPRPARSSRCTSPAPARPIPPARMASRRGAARRSPIRCR